MPTGIIINSLSIILGGIAGGLFGDYLRDDFKENLNLHIRTSLYGYGN
ncbi:hypothetical protein Y022_08605 [Streptococcus thermophilus TH1477]|uniref:DUF554 domain-containing protein n=1 Tax=Streptococcus thermophilus M17PTZA496 TaxID=1433289 RepID=A0A0E2Q1P0_STRTR|nr:hypothetical protein X841_09695 [Streptococcus thermophilus M17PTZA496]EWM61026.1 hypothetical protein Y022_08605 [Streptococcus thermophilus TH1477]